MQVIIILNDPVWGFWIISSSVVIELVSTSITSISNDVLKLLYVTIIVLLPIVVLSNSEIVISPLSNGMLSVVSSKYVTVSIPPVKSSSSLSFKYLVLIGTVDILISLMLFLRFPHSLKAL